MSDIGSGQVGVVVTKLEGRGPLNLLGRDTFLGLNAELDRLDQDRSVRAIILTGSGDRAFSAGVDLEQMKDLEPCLLYTSPSPRDGLLSRMPSSA